MSPGAPGTLKLQRRFGVDLLAVRYRYDWAGLVRLTTVELVVARSDLQWAQQRDRQFGVEVGRQEHELRDQLREHGATWRRELGCWVVSAQTVQSLGIVARVRLVLQDE